MYKKIFLSLLLLFVTLFSFYSAVWFYFAGIIDREVNKFMTAQQKNGIVFEGLLSPAHGFPGIYQLVYTGDIVTPDTRYVLPKLVINGIPLEGMNISLQAPLGITVEHPAVPDAIKKIDYAMLILTVPRKPPPALTFAHLKIWQAENNARLAIPSLTLQWPDASIFAETSITLNDDLQPEGTSTIGLTNHTFFIDIFADKLELSDSQRLMILSFLNALNKNNGAVVIPFRIQNGALYMGMIRLASLPLIMWPGSAYSARVRPDSPLAPLQ